MGNNSQIDWVKIIIVLYLGMIIAIFGYPLMAFLFGYITKLL
jgi:hypothetical protein